MPRETFLEQLRDLPPGSTLISIVTRLPDGSFIAGAEMPETCLTMTQIPKLLYDAVCIANSMVPFDSEE